MQFRLFTCDCDDLCVSDNDRDVDERGKKSSPPYELLSTPRPIPCNSAFLSELPDPINGSDDRKAQPPHSKPSSNSFSFSKFYQCAKKKF